MKVQNIITAAAVTLILSACGPAQNQNSSTGDGIRHGFTANQGDRISKSTVAVIGGEFQMICTGTLIAKDVVLTAAHCISDEVQMYVVFDVKATNTRAYRPANAIIVHPHYESDLQDANGKTNLNRNDIAIIRFSGDVPAGYEVATILNDFSIIKKGLTATVAGYGVHDDFPVIKGPPASDFVGDGTGLLRSTRITVLNGEFSESEVLLDQRLGTGACQGDSGGPAYAEVNGKLQVWGVASWGSIRQKDSACLSSVVYTKIEPYKPFIAKVMDLLRKNPVTK